MSDADRAYKLAKAKISEAQKARATRLMLQGQDFKALAQLPEEIAKLSSLEMLALNDTQITDIEVISGLVSLRFLDLRKTPISDVAPLRKLTELRTLQLDDTQVTDLRPIMELGKLEEDNVVGLSFRNTPATKIDAQLAELARLDDPKARTRETLAYLRSLPTFPDLYSTKAPSKDGSTRNKSIVADFPRLDSFINENIKNVANSARLEQVAEHVDDLQQRISDVRAQLAGNLEAISTLSSLTKKIADLESQLAKTADKAATQQSSVKKQDVALSNLRKRLESFEADVESRIANANKDYAESMEAAEAAFTESNAIKAPVALWKDKQTEHETARDSAWRRFFWGLVAVAALVVLLLVVFVIWTDTVQALFAPIGCNPRWPESCSGFSLRGWLSAAGVLTLFTVLLLYTRLQMKLYLAERHLVLDARERRAFAQTYVGLLKEGDTSSEAQQQRAMVYAALFRPASDGTVKEEGGLDPAVTAALSRYLSK